MQSIDYGFVQENMMGPNAVKLLKEMADDIQLNPGMRVLDLGCGKGLTSIYLAKKYNVQVFAVDLWISATENYERFQKMQLEKRIIPINSDALKLPFAYGYFDSIISVDSYHYFGRDEQYIDLKLAPYIKKGGVIALCFPGLKHELDRFPAEMKLSWTKDDFDTWRSCEWWENLICKSKEVKIISIKEMKCFDECWQDWLSCKNEYAREDCLAMQAGAGKYMNFISVICRRIE